MASTEDVKDRIKMYRTVLHLQFRRKVKKKNVWLNSHMVIADDSEFLVNGVRAVAKKSLFLLSLGRAQG